jgi:hypothetical protein
MLPDFVPLSLVFGLSAVLSLMSAVTLRRSLPAARRGWGRVLVLPPIVTLVVSAFGTLVFIFVLIDFPTPFGDYYYPSGMGDFFLTPLVNGLVNGEVALAWSVLGISLYGVALLAIGWRSSVERA